MIITILLLVIAAGLLYFFKEWKLQKNILGEQIEERKEQEISKAVDKIESGSIEYLVDDHNAEIDRRDKPNS